MNRKQFLRTSGTLLAGSTLLPLAGCGSSPSDPKPKPPGNNYVNGAVALANVDDNGEVFKVSGTVTFPNGTTLPVADGLAQFGTQQQISPGRYRVQVLPAQEGDFPSHSDYITVREDHASIFEMVPKKIGSYSYNDFLDTFGYGDDENRHTRRWADNSVIISYHYDESHVLEDIEAAVGTFYRSNDPTKVASPYFIQNSIAALQEVVQMIPDSANIQINSFIESEGEIEFPRGYDYSEEGVMFHAGSPDAQYLLTQRYNIDGPRVFMSTLRQRTGFSDSQEFDAPAATRSDVLENMGIHTTGHGDDVAHYSIDGFWTPDVPHLLNAVYSFKPGTGRRKLSSPLPGPNGSFLNTIDHYVPD